MNNEENRQAAKTSCTQCPLRQLDCYRDFSGGELDFMQRFKMGELIADAGATILGEGARSAHMYTALRGVGFRYKMLEDGRRQILNYFFPGDLIGLQSALMAEMQHSVEALTPVSLCVFERERLNELFRKHPGLAYDMTWIAAREERILDEHLLSIGRRSAMERAAYLMAFLHMRASQTGFTKSGVMPVTQQHVADTLGLSIVHTNRTLKKLAQRGMIQWKERGCIVKDPKGLAAIAGWEPDRENRKPFL